MGKNKLESNVSETIEPERGQPMTEKELNDLGEHYRARCEPAITPLVKLVAEAAKTDPVELLYIVEVCQSLFRHAINQTDLDDEMPLTLKGWPTSVAGGEGGTTDKKA